MRSRGLDLVKGGDQPLAAHHQRPAGAVLGAAPPHQPPRHGLRDAQDLLDRPAIDPISFELLERPNGIPKAMEIDGLGGHDRGYPKSYGLRNGRFIYRNRLFR
jgi:hypothetical protein